jgi:site-specific DNA-methyltransferase (adenine-specific)
MLDEQSGVLESGIMEAGAMRSGGQAVALGHFSGQASVVGTYGDAGGASRFFYTAKPNRDERDAGLDDLDSRTAGQATGRVDGSDGLRSPRAGSGRTSDGVKNHHPTVKPVAVMEWLVDLVAPPGGLVLDPFCGSGTTGVAAVRRARSFVGMEREADYVEIAVRRIKHWSRGQLDLLGRIA